jgi:hypothetical protein
MLELLERRDPELFEAFCDALIESDQRYIVNKYLKPKTCAKEPENIQAQLMPSSSTTSASEPTIPSSECDSAIGQFAYTQVGFIVMFQGVPWSVKLQPWISLLHFTLSFTSFSDKCILFISSFMTSAQVLLGLPLGLLPSTTNSVHFLTQSSSPFLLACPNHLNLLLLHTSPIVSTPTLSLSSELVFLSLVAIYVDRALADLDTDGRMDRKEFSIAMHLIKRMLHGQDVPAVLPPSLRLDPLPSVQMAPSVGMYAPPSIPGSTFTVPGGSFGQSTISESTFCLSKLCVSVLTEFLSHC